MFFFFQAEDGIRYLVRSRGLGDVYKRQHDDRSLDTVFDFTNVAGPRMQLDSAGCLFGKRHVCLLYTSDAADERSSVDLGGRRIIKKKKSAR